jgi:hypothetical protein
MNYFCFYSRQFVCRTLYFYNFVNTVFELIIVVYIIAHLSAAPCTNLLGSNERILCQASQVPIYRTELHFYAEHF